MGDRQTNSVIADGPTPMSFSVVKTGGEAQGDAIA
jgi:hypothetical protein